MHVFGSHTDEPLRVVLLCASFLVLSSPAFAQSFWERFTDPEDGAFDISSQLASQAGFLPVVLPITEPAVGFGLAGAVSYFHPRAPGSDVDRDGQMVPPSISVVGGLATTNGSWAVGGGHRGVWNQNRIRYLGGAGYGSFNLTYYGRHSESGDDPRDFTIEGLGIVQELAFRLGHSNFFVGPTYRFATTQVRFATGTSPVSVNDDEIESKTGGLGIALEFDGLDNFFTPSTGLAGELAVSRYDTFLGGDFEYWKGQFVGLAFLDALAPVVLGLRLEAKVAGEAAPFWDLPYVDMRGIPAFRFLGEFMISQQLEVRWDVTPRWSLVGFGGVGATAVDMNELTSSDFVGSGGGGFRYLLARAFGLRAGIDVARGPEEWVGYVTIGSAWLRP
jgi:hypothetical protein